MTPCFPRATTFAQAKFMAAVARLEALMEDFPPHQYRPMTTRDGSHACSWCHAPPDHPVHGGTCQNGQEENTEAQGLESL